MANKVINATVTGTAGPGNTVSAVVYNALTSVTFDAAGILTLVDGNGKVIKISINGATTFTVTISGSTYTVVVS